MKREGLEEIIRNIDAQIEARSSKPEPGDRRRAKGVLPDGFSERRIGIERRAGLRQNDVPSRDCD